MKKQTAVLIGLGALAVAGVPTVVSVLAMQNMQAEVKSAQVTAQAAIEEKESAILKANKEAEEQAAAREAEDLAQQREVMREVAEERAQEAQENNTTVAWEQFTAVLLDSMAKAELEGASLEQLSRSIVSGIEAIPLINVDSQAASSIQSVGSVFQDARQNIIDYNAQVKALADRTPGATFSAGVDGCSLVTDTFDSDSPFWNAVGCAGGMLAGAGISSAGAEEAAKQLDSEYEENMDAIFTRFVEIDEALDSTAAYLEVEYGIATPKEVLE